MRHASDGINAPGVVKESEEPATGHNPSPEESGSGNGTLPEGVSADKAIRQLAVPKISGHRYSLPRSSIARTYRYLREAGEEVSVRELMQEVYVNSHLERSLSMTPPDWFREVVRDYLPRLPGVRDIGGRTWVFDPTAAERPPFNPGKTLRKPSEEEADANLREFDFPGRIPEDSISNYNDVRAIYEEIREKRRLTRGGVYDHHEPATVRRPADGLFDETDSWYALMVRPALEQLPDLLPPAMPAGEWRYLGLKNSAVNNTNEETKE